MIRSGEFVSEYVRKVNGDKVEDKRIQPNGIDLTIEGIYIQKGHPILTDGEYEMQDRELMPYRTHPEYGNIYDLPLGAYIVEYNEVIEIPDGHVGYVLPRSRLMRCGIFLTSALWDQGYTGRGEGMLMVWPTMAHVSDDMSIGQIVLCKADSRDDEYDGKHQGERLGRRGGASDDKVEELIEGFLLERGPTDHQRVVTKMVSKKNVSGRAVQRVIRKSNRFVIDDSDRVHLTGE